MNNTDDFYKEYETFSEEDRVKVDLLYTHKIVGDYIWVDFASGKIKMAYKAIKLDQYGYPQVMGDVSTRLAIEWYIKQKYLESLWMMGKVADKVYQQALQHYQWYIGQATNEILIPDPIEAEAIGNTIVRLIPHTDNVESGHKYDSQKERLRTNNNRWIGL